jgi:hypothetical protein
MGQRFQRREAGLTRAGMSRLLTQARLAYRSVMSMVERTTGGMQHDRHPFDRLAKGSRSA